MTTSFTPSRMCRDLQGRSLRPALRPGPELISLAHGDPHFPTPEHISQALTDALAAGATHYAQTTGELDLRGALAEQMTEVAGRSYRGDQGAITHGGSGALAGAILPPRLPGARGGRPTATHSC